MTEPTPLGQSETSVQNVKDSINLALDHIESAGFDLADLMGYSSLIERLGKILADLDQWKADAWEALDA